MDALIQNGTCADIVEPCASGSSCADVVKGESYVCVCDDVTATALVVASVDFVASSTTSYFVDEASASSTKCYVANDDCSSDNAACGANAICTDSLHGHSCDCDEGFYGDGLICLPLRCADEWHCSGDNTICVISETEEPLCVCDSYDDTKCRASMSFGNVTNDCTVHNALYGDATSLCGEGFGCDSVPTTSDNSDQGLYRCLCLSEMPFLCPENFAFFIAGAIAMVVVVTITLVTVRSRRRVHGTRHSMNTDEKLDNNSNHDISSVTASVVVTDSLNDSEDIVLYNNTSTINDTLATQIKVTSNVSKPPVPPRADLDQNLHHSRSLQHQGSPSKHYNFQQKQLRQRSQQPAQQEQEQLQLQEDHQQEQEHRHQQQPEQLTQQQPEQSRQQQQQQQCSHQTEQACCPSSKTSLNKNFKEMQVRELRRWRMHQQQNAQNVQYLPSHLEQARTPFNHNNCSISEHLPSVGGNTRQNPRPLHKIKTQAKYNSVDGMNLSQGSPLPHLIAAATTSERTLSSKSTTDVNDNKDEGCCKKKLQKYLSNDMMESMVISSCGEHVISKGTPVHFISPKRFKTASSADSSLTSTSHMSLSLPRSSSASSAGSMYGRLRNKNNITKNVCSLGNEDTKGLKKIRNDDGILSKGDRVIVRGSLRGTVKYIGPLQGLPLGGMIYLGKCQQSVRVSLYSLKNKFMKD